MDQDITLLKGLLIENKFLDEHGFEQLVSNNESKSPTDLIVESFESRDPKEVQRFIDVVRQSALVGSDQSDTTDCDKCITTSKTQWIYDEMLYELKDLLVTTEDIDVNIATQPMTSPDCYPMTGHPRGNCVIINNKKFKRKHAYRRGSVSDEQRLTNVFTKLGFNVKVYHNLSASIITRKLKDVSEDPNLAKHDALVVIILSHGTYDDLVIGYDDMGVSVDSLLELFNCVNCPELIGERDPGVKLIPKKDSLSSLSSLGNAGPEYSVSHRATWSDFFVFHSTFKNCVSLRNAHHGSFFGYELAYGLAEWANTTEFLKLMTQKVADKVEQRQSLVDNGKDKDIVKQAIETRVLGTVKDLYFNPGL